MVLEKTPESPLDSREIKPVNLKGNQPWIHFGRTNAEAEAPVFWPPDANSRVIGKVPDAGKDWRQEEKGVSEDEMAGWHHWLSGHLLYLSLSCVQFLATPWTVAHQAPSVHGILQARILEWVAMPSSRRSSQPQDGTQVSHIAGRFFTVWATRKAPQWTWIWTVWSLLVRDQEAFCAAVHEVAKSQTQLSGWTATAKGCLTTRFKTASIPS